MKAMVSFLVLSVVAGATPARAQSNSEVLRGPTVATARRFVETHMREYAPSNSDAILGLGTFLARHPQFLDPSLLQALVADTLRQARNPGEIVGMDFDPFLAGQDRCPRIDVGPASWGRGRFRVELRQVCGETPGDTADAVFLLHINGGSLAVSNILYPRAHTDLKKVLAELAASK